MEELNFEIVKGNTFTRTFSVTSNNSPVDLTGTTVKFMVKNSYNDLDIDALITSQISDFIDNTFTINISSNDTNLTPNSYVYEIRFDTLTTKVTKMVGKFKVTNNVIKS